MTATGAPDVSPVKTLPAKAGSMSLPAHLRAMQMPPLIMAAGLWILFLVFVAAFADLLAPHHYTEQNLRLQFQPPLLWGGTWTFPFGTDNLGRDILSRLIYGVRFSILIAVLGTLIGAVLGTVLGFFAAHRRGLVEEIIMMLVDFQAAVPFIILALAVLAFFGNNFVLFIIIIGLDGWERYARLTRGLVRSANTSGYAVAARALGARPLRVYAGHILPNVISALVVQMTLNFPGTMLLETSLSFLGLGVQPPLTSLGLMLGSGRGLLLNAWWIAALPGMVIFLTTLSMSLFGDWLRDRLDPTLGRT